MLSEDDLVRGIRMTYEPPLPYLESPLLAALGMVGLELARVLGPLVVVHIARKARKRHVKQALLRVGDDVRLDGLCIR